MHTDGTAVHRADEAAARVAAAILASADPADTHGAAELAVVERAACRRLLRGELIVDLLDRHNCRVGIPAVLIRVCVPHQAVVLLPASARLAPDLGAGAAPAGLVAATLPPLVGNAVRGLKSRHHSRPALAAVLAVQGLLLRRLEARLLVLVVSLPVWRDDALQLVPVPVRHARRIVDVVDRRLVLLVDILHVDRILRAGAAAERRRPGRDLLWAMRRVGLLPAAQPATLVLEVRARGVVLLLRSEVPLLRAQVVEGVWITTSSGRRPPHLGLRVLGPPVDDARLHELPLAILAVGLTQVDGLDRHLGDLRLLTLRRLFVLQRVVSGLYGHLVDHVSRRERAIRA